MSLTWAIQTVPATVPDVIGESMAQTAYPKVASKAWTVLRARAATAPSTRFTSHVVASMLGMANPKSASDNIVGPMRRLGLFTEDGSLTERGSKWRVDATYGDACQEILEEIYPAELAALTNGEGVVERSQVENWFQHHGFGGSNARQMAATYSMIAEKKLPDPSPTEPKKTPPKKRPQSPVSHRSSNDSSQEMPSPEKSSSSFEGNRQPNVHLDIQIHIPANASMEQIDQIFASMAKHLYQR